MSISRSTVLRGRALQSAIRNLKSAIPAILGLLALAGCSTYADRLRNVRSEFHAGNLNAAEQFVAKELPKKRRAKEADVLKLERAMVELCSGHPTVSERTLREVREIGRAHV